MTRIAVWVFSILLGLLAAGITRALYNCYMQTIWQAAAVPELEEIGGLYRVWMLPRWLFFWFLNVKRIVSKGNSARPGQNTAYGCIKWGKFHAASTVGRGLTFVYNSGTIRDYIGRIAPGRYLGKFCLRRGDREVFVFWFLLIRKGVGADLGAWGSKQDDRHGRA